MKCEHERTVDKMVTFKNGTEHIERRCADCQKWIKYVSQEKEYVFWVGKYKGQTLTEVMGEDMEYVWNCLENWDGGQQRKLQEAVDRLAK